VFKKVYDERKEIGYGNASQELDEIGVPIKRKKVNKRRGITPEL
jgi:hypothetical protein